MRRSAIVFDRTNTVTLPYLLIDRKGRNRFKGPLAFICIIFQVGGRVAARRVKTFRLARRTHDARCTMHDARGTHPGVSKVRTCGQAGMQPPTGKIVRAAKPKEINESHPHPDYIAPPPSAIFTTRILLLPLQQCSNAAVATIAGIGPFRKHRNFPSKSLKLLKKDRNFWKGLQPPLRLQPQYLIKALIY